MEGEIYEITNAIEMIEIQMCVLGECPDIEKDDGDPFYVWEDSMSQLQARHIELLKARTHMCRHQELLHS